MTAPRGSRGAPARGPGPVPRGGLGPRGAAQHNTAPLEKMTGHRRLLAGQWAGGFRYIVIQL